MSDAPVRAVLFDVDDTLVDHSSARRCGVVAFLSALGRPHDEAAVTAWREAEDRHFGRHLAGELSFQEQRRERIRELFGASVPDAEADALFDRYVRELQAGWAAFADSAACLQALRAAGLRLGIVTNAEAAYQRAKLAAVGLADLVEVVVGLDTVGAGKPDPRPFLHACEALGVPPAQTVHVGDHLDWDVVGAARAGLRPVWLDRTGAAASAGPLPPGAVVAASLEALPGLVLATTAGAARELEAADPAADLATDQGA